MSVALTLEAEALSGEVIGPDSFTIPVIMPTLYDESNEVIGTVSALELLDGVYTATADIADAPTLAGLEARELMLRAGLSVLERSHTRGLIMITLATLESLHVVAAPPIPVPTPVPE